jgi:hypothetical protein
MAIEIVDLSIENGDFPQLCKRLPEGYLLWDYFMIELISVIGVVIP